jgi:hypothetical protein
MTAHRSRRWAQVLHDETDRVKILDSRTVQFEFKRPFLDFPRLIGAANVSAPGGSSRRIITKTSERTALLEGRSVLGPTSLSRNAIGPRIAAQKWQDVFPSFISTGYAYPWEEIKLKA